MIALAVALMVVIGLAHSYLGERYILVRMFRRADLPELFGDTTFTRHTIRMAWHLTTIAWWGIAAALLALRSDAASEGAVLQVFGVTFALSAGFAAIATRARHLSWAVFLSISVLCWLAATPR